MRVSVVIPTYNRVHTLARALDSVLAQSCAPHEVIVVDDGSVDTTHDLLTAEYAGVTVVAQPNRGVSAARNAGIDAATGNWIAFLDSDDEWHRDRLAQQCDALATHRDDTGRPFRLCHTDEIWIRNGRRVNPMKKHEKRGGWIYDRCLPLCAISPSTVMMERELLHECGGFDETLPACEDYDLWLRVCARHPVLFLPQQLVTRYGGHADQLSRAHWGMDRFRIRALEKILVSGILTDGQQRATEEMLALKIGVVVKGARRRGRNREADALARRTGPSGEA